MDLMRTSLLHAFASVNGGMIGGRGVVNVLLLFQIATSPNHFCFLFDEDGRSEIVSSLDLILLIAFFYPI